MDQVTPHVPINLLAAEVERLCAVSAANMARIAAIRAALKAKGEA